MGGQICTKTNKHFIIHRFQVDELISKAQSHVSGERSPEAPPAPPNFPEESAVEDATAEDTMAKSVMKIIVQTQIKKCLHYLTFSFFPSVTGRRRKCYA